LGGKAAEAGEGWFGTFSDASGNAGLDDSGYVLTYNTSTAKLEKATKGTDPVCGVNAINTVNPLWPGGWPGEITSKFTQYLVDPKISVLDDGVVDVRVDSATNRATDIKIGDLLALSESTDGVVVQWTDNVPCNSIFKVTVTATLLAEAWEQIVGIAREDLAQTANPADGESKILTKLTIKGVVS